MKADGAVYVHRCSWQLYPNVTRYKIVGVAVRGPFCMQSFPGSNARIEVGVYIVQFGCTTIINPHCPGGSR